MPTGYTPGFGAGGGTGLPPPPPPPPRPNPLITLINTVVNIVKTVITTAANVAYQQVTGNTPPPQTTQARNSGGNSPTPSDEEELRIAQRRLEAQRAEEENRRRWLEANEIGRDFFQRFTPSDLGFVNSGQSPNPYFYQRDDSSQFFPFTPLNNPVADLLNRRNNQPPFPPPFPFSFEFNTEQRYIPQQNTLSLDELFGAQWTRTQAPMNPLLVGVIDLAPTPIQPALFAMGLEGFGPSIAMPTDFNGLVTVNLGQTVDPEAPAIIATNTQYQTLIRRENGGIAVRTPILQSTSQQTPSSNQGGGSSQDWLALLLLALAAASGANAARIALEDIGRRWIEDLRRSGFSLLDPERQTFDDFPLDPNLNSNQIMADPLEPIEPYREGFNLDVPQQPIIQESTDWSPNNDTHSYRTPSPSRHDAMRIGVNAPNDQITSVVDDWEMLRRDIEAINNGEGNRSGNQYEINGRIYEVTSSFREGVQPELVPVEGPGITQLSRSQFKALQNLLRYDYEQAEYTSQRDPSISADDFRIAEQLWRSISNR